MRGQFDGLRTKLSVVAFHIPWQCIFLHNLNTIFKKLFRGLYRDLKSFDPDRYVYDLRNAALEGNLLSTEGANDQYSKLHKILVSKMEKHASLKPITKKMDKQCQKPWITKGILKSISIKN